MKENNALKGPPKSLRAMLNIPLLSVVLVFFTIDLLGGVGLQETITVSGKISDSLGTPLPGITISLRGNDRVATSTDRINMVQ